jgi:hypothetical protein
MQAQHAQGHETAAKATEKRFKQAGLGSPDDLDLKRL